jgi:hypothetical protein
VVSFGGKPRDGFVGPGLLGRVCWKHGRFTFECGCEPAEKEKTVQKTEEDEE